MLMETPNLTIIMTASGTIILALYIVLNIIPKRKASPMLESGPAADIHISAVRGFRKL